jgi:hypothetical protein
MSIRRALLNMVAGTFTPSLGPCWIWQASLDSDGYGQWRPPRGRTRKAHRFAYEETVGPIPKGMELDHLCRVRSCVRGSHLEPVTGRVNRSRSPLPNGGALYSLAKTQCPAGHAYDAANTYIYRGRRICRACGREKSRQSRSARRLAAHARDGHGG